MSSPKPAFFKETLKTLVYAGVIALVFRTFAYEPFNIPSESMVPNLVVGDYLFVSKLSYGYGAYSAPMGLLGFLKNRLAFSAPERGDVVVFRLPSNPNISYIKRLIGLPGDTIELRDGRLYINNQKISRTALPPFQEHSPTGTMQEYPRYRETLPNGKSYEILETMGDKGALDNTRAFAVPEGHYFFMGDNRDRSEDSRAAVGFVPEANLTGRAEVIFFSLNCQNGWTSALSCLTDMRFDRFFKRIR